MKNLKMKFYKKIILEDKSFLETLGLNVNKLSKVLGVKQPYLHKIIKGELVVSEKQYNKFVEQISKYQKGPKNELSRYQK